MEQEQQVYVSVGKDSYTTNITAGAHQLIADEPVNVGGKDKGPDPYSLILSALGACTAITLRMYSDRKEWNLEKVDVMLSESKIHKEDCEKVEDEDDDDKMQISVKITLHGNLQPDQERRLLQIAKKCPVHKLLVQGVKIEMQN